MSDLETQSRLRLRSVKRLVLGRPISSHQEMHQRLPKRIALAVFSSDALSSSAYATDEILLALVAAGSLALSRSIPIAVVVAAVLAVVIVSYRQTVRAYPTGGGAYIVAKDNLGEPAGLVAASALLIDYVLTVAVSTAAGIAAVVAAFPEIADHRVSAAIAVVALITVANLRGLKESGTLFAVPTYGFILVVGVMIVTGLVRLATGAYHPPPVRAFAAEQPLTVFLLLRAFASGSTALTGVEAISNGVPAFRRPESRNAAATLTVLGVLLTFLFLGITFLANVYHADPHLIEEGQTVPSQIARQVFGDGSVLFFLTQVFTALILFLAANTSYADFPRLASILSRDRYLPVVLRSRGDKLAFSNGIVLLAFAAGAVLWLYQANVHRIIPLYVIGVFTSFTLSQLGMVVHWRRLRGPGWRGAAVVNGIGAGTTLVALVVVGIVKFPLGAWQVILLIPAVAWLLRRVHLHYEVVGAALRAGPFDVRLKATRAVVLVADSATATTRAVALARAFAPREVHVVAFRVRERRLRAVRQRWADLELGIPIEATGHRPSDLIEYLRGLEPSSAEPLTVVMSSPSHPRYLRQVVRNRALIRIRRALVGEPGVVVCSTTYAPAETPPAGPLRGPVSLSVIVVVSAVHRAAFRALRYAQALRPTELVALSVALDPEDMHRLSEDWSRAGIDIPLEIVDSPFRSLVDPVLAEVRQRRPSPADAVAVVIPEPVVEGWRWKPLHGQRALLLKAALLFEPDVLVFDVPFHVGPTDGTRR